MFFFYLKQNGYFKLTYRMKFIKNSKNWMRLNHSGLNVVLSTIVEEKRKSIVLIFEKLRIAWFYSGFYVYDFSLQFPNKPYLFLWQEIMWFKVIQNFNHLLHLPTCSDFNTKIYCFAYLAPRDSLQLFYHHN